MAILNLYQSFWEKLSEKIQNSHFWPFQIYTSPFGKNCWKKFLTAIFGHSEFIQVFLGKIWNGYFWSFPIYTSFLGGGKLSEKFKWPFLAILNLYKSFWEKFGMAIFGHSQYIPVFWGGGEIVRKI